MVKRERYKGEKSSPQQQFQEMLISLQELRGEKMGIASHA